MRLDMLEIWQHDNHQSASMKKRISDHNEKTKPDQKQKWGAVWTTATVICMFRDLWQQHIWYWPPTTTSLLTSSALGNAWRFNIDQCTEFLSISLKLKRKRIDKERWTHRTRTLQVKVVNLGYTPNLAILHNAKKCWDNNDQYQT